MHNTIKLLLLSTHKMDCRKMDTISEDCESRRKRARPVGRTICKCKYQMKRSMLRLLMSIMMLMSKETLEILNSEIIPDF